MKKIAFFATLLSLIVILAWLFGKQPKTNINQRILITTSFYPLADFTKNIGGDYVEVLNIVPTGIEPHDYEPTPQDIARIYNSKIFIFNGGGLDSWANRIESDLKAKGIIVLNIESLLPEENKIPSDPHFWLSLNNAEKEADLITSALIQADPLHKENYDSNKNHFKTKLSDLDSLFKNSLSNCRLHKIIVSHDAFNYLAKNYSFESLYILGINPEAEPSPQVLAKITEEIKKDNIKYIFAESLLSPKISEIISSETNTQVLTLNPIEGLTSKEVASRQTYLDLMKNNLDNLKIALECQSQ